MISTTSSLTALSGLTVALALTAAPPSGPSIVSSSPAVAEAAPSSPSTNGSGLIAGLDMATDTFMLVVAEEGNEARYRVREQLARLNFPNDAVGVTQGVQGRIMMTSDGDVVSGGSRFLINLHELESDSDRRDNYLRRRTLDTENYPEARFVPTGFQGLPTPLPESGSVNVVLEGDLTIREVTRPVEWQVEVEFWEGAILGQARTTITFDDFELEVPSVGSVLSIREDIRLEMDFRLVPDGGT